MSTEALDRGDRRGRVRIGGSPRFWIGLALGWGVMAVGVAAMLGERAAAPGKVVPWVLGSLVIHDALFLPTTIIAGLLTGLIPRVVRLPVRVGLALSLVLVLVAWPGATRNGAKPDNPTLLPHDVGLALRWLLVTLWIVVGAEVARRSLAGWRAARAEADPR